MEFEDSENVETALALSGSAAQSKIQTYPGDADYFERVNILAPTQRRGVPYPGQDYARKGSVHTEGTYLPIHRDEAGLVPL